MRVIGQSVVIRQTETHNKKSIEDIIWT